MPITQTAQIKIYKADGATPLSTSPFYWGISQITLTVDGRIAKLSLLDATKEPKLFSFILPQPTAGEKFTGLLLRASIPESTAWIEIGETKSVNIIDVLELKLKYISPNGRITVYDEQGAPVFETQPAVTITSISLNASEDSAAFTWTGDGKTLSATFNVKREGFAFLGLSKSQGGALYIRPGETLPESITAPLALYEVYEPYSPPSDTLELILYNMKGDPSVVDKTKYLTKLASYRIVFKGGVDVKRPKLLIKADTLPAFNYVEIPKFKRFYFLAGAPSPARTGEWVIELTEDPLMTFKDGILQCTAFIDRQEFRYNQYLVDDLLPVRVTTDRIIKKFAHEAGTPELTRNKNTFPYCIIAYTGE